MLFWWMYCTTNRFCNLRCKKIREKAIQEKRILRICSETNGLENSKKLKEFASISLDSGGGIKFDLKTFSEELSIALTGVSKKKVF
ncbi:MAG: hypothetical protein NZ889_02800 [Candidatus Pacearchaeota archaeon]|nr:hypothetical protein [Candidatus Pacearchaeota archaeon]